MQTLPFMIVHTGLYVAAESSIFASDASTTAKLKKTAFNITHAHLNILVIRISSEPEMSEII